jgi:hypothetical protein
MVGPVGPVGPVLVGMGPVGPVIESPVDPVGPVREDPVAPVDPVADAEPGAPVIPVGPVGPENPVGPVPAIATLSGNIKAFGAERYTLNSVVILFILWYNNTMIFYFSTPVLPYSDTASYSNLVLGVLFLQPVFQ